MVQVADDGGAPTFRGRSPRALGFGTSGLRGLVEDISDLEAYINTRGFLDYLLAHRLCTTGCTVALGGDLRPSTARILEAVARAVVDAGMQPSYQGRLPTPALTAWAISAGMASIMVTGSHIPFDRNGIKFNRPDGEILKHDEAPILAAVAAVRAHEYGRQAGASAFADDGSLRRPNAPAMPAADEASRYYRARFLSAFPRDALTGLRLGFFAHSAVGREQIPELLTALGAEVHSFGRSEVFVPIDTEALSAEALADLQRQADGLVARVGALDAVISTDGDSDRPLLLACNTAGGLEFISGDLLGLAVAEYLEADAIAVPVSASDAIERYFQETPVALCRTRIGSPWVIAAMQQQAGARRVGWEANGGFLTGSTLTTAHGELPALPTRDAVLPLVCALHAAKRAGTDIAAWFARFPARFSRAGLLDAVDAASSRAVLEQLGPLSNIRRLRYRDDDLLAEDFEGETVALDASARAGALERAALIAEYLALPLNIEGELVEADALDGLRLYFSSGEIIHLRPSGNAPQLRIYAVADSAARAESLVNSALAEPGGVLRGLLQRFAI